MAFALSIRSENDSAAAIGSLWKETAAFEAAPSMDSLAYPPHITLARYDGDIDIEMLRLAACRAFERKAALRLSFTRLRYFDVSPLVLWAEPTPSPALLQLHDAIHQVVPPLLCDSHYRPGSWRPHCTLAFHVGDDRRQDAIAWSKKPIESIEVTFDVGDIVSFPPVHIVEHWPLSNA